VATQITVTAMEPEWFGVQIAEGNLRTSHRVRLTGGLVDDLMLGDEVPEDVVRESIRYLLDREPSSEIPDEVILDRVEAEDHGFADELRARLGR
jgi:hypothetical protein